MGHADDPASGHAVVAANFFSDAMLNKAFGVVSGLVTVGFFAFACYSFRTEPALAMEMTLVALMGWGITMFWVVVGWAALKLGVVLFDFLWDL